MRFLIIGSGAREHAVAQKLVEFGHEVVGLTFNYGITQLGVCDQTTPLTIHQAVLKHSIDVVFIGPEKPLCEGLVDELHQLGIPVVGPTKAASAIEGSKTIGRQVCYKGGIPSPIWASFADFNRAKNFSLGQSFDTVIKEDGLASGKGVTVTYSSQEAIAVLQDYQLKGYFDSGHRLILEQRLEGREVSAHAFTDNIAVAHMPFSCDHKALYDGGKGPNTGGMGAYAPVPWLGSAVERVIQQDITERALETLDHDFHHSFEGILYPGVMVTEEGPKVLEFNCRFGDPEACVLLPLLETDLGEIFRAIAWGYLEEVKPKIRWSNRFAVGVVLASEGYPEKPLLGRSISGLESVDPEVKVFHAGTQSLDGKLVTAGGRVLTVVGTGSTLEEARGIVYDNVKRIRFEGMYCRTDIGLI